MSANAHTPEREATKDLFRVAFADQLASATRILIAGAGGGFDVFAGLPLYFSLIAQGKQAHLANLSFTTLGATSARRVAEALYEVGPECSGEARYFPELYLAEWLAQNGYASAVYAFDNVGVRPLRAAYAQLVAEHGIDALVLIDGGTDILMRGDEAGLGTPAEDMTSLAAANGLALPKKLVSCVGFGIDAFHGVCHAHFLENVAALEQSGAFLGAHSVHLSHPSVSKFRAAVEHAHARMPERPSIVNGSILSALEGRFGNYQRTQRTRGSTLFINPLMTLYWHFDLAGLAARSLYLPLLEGSESIFDVQLRIEAFRHSIEPRPRLAIPV